VSWLWDQGVAEVVAHIHPEHSASNGIARSLGLEPTDVFVDGERRWDRAR
jgi:RimJ/RimL family protein N-acetyltransferase